MAYAQTMSPQAIHNHYRDGHQLVPQPAQRRHASKQRFVADLSQCLFDFVIQLLPTPEEMAIKEDVRKLLERLIRTIEPESRLLSFGSTANGFSLRNSDMDLCCLIDSSERLSATDLVTMLGDLLERETKFHVKPLPHARIPIVKLSLDPSPGLPSGIACDIGFENRLALENTRLLMCYAMIDPTRIRTLVLFLKVWSKRRKINSPYKGTLSSYGYVLLVIYFLVHVKNPPVLPNLQQVPPLRPITKEDTHIGGYNTWFFDDIEVLRQRWHPENTETVAELLIDFFRYFSRDFSYNTGVASIRAGLLKKESKGWQNDLSNGRYNDARERNRLCIEDPFEIDYNVARCVTKDGLYTIRGEFMRAARILASRPERAILALAELCEERPDEDLVSPPPFVAPRLSNFPPQTPYSVGSQPMRPKGLSLPDGLSPPSKFFESGPRDAVPPEVPEHAPSPPEHMAPKRGKWTSPPPPEAPPADHTRFESQLGKGLELATAATDAREKEPSNSSSSDILTDDGRSEAAESDEITSVRSYSEGSNLHHAGPHRRPSWHIQESSSSSSTARVGPMSSLGTTVALSPGSVRVRYSRSTEKPTGVPAPSPPISTHPPSSFRPPLQDIQTSASSSSPRAEFSKRAMTGSPSSAAAVRITRGASWSSDAPLGAQIPLPPSPSSPLDTNPHSHFHPHHRNATAPTNHGVNSTNDSLASNINNGSSSPSTFVAESSSTVYYQTTSPRPTNLIYPSPPAPISHAPFLLAQYRHHTQFHPPHQAHHPTMVPVPSPPLSLSASPSSSAAAVSPPPAIASASSSPSMIDPPDILPASLPSLSSPAPSTQPLRSFGSGGARGRRPSGPDTPTPTPGAYARQQHSHLQQQSPPQHQPSHAHTLSNATIMAPAPTSPARANRFSTTGSGNLSPPKPPSSPVSSYHSRSRSGDRAPSTSTGYAGSASGSGPSSASSDSVSRSPSPPSPLPLPPPSPSPPQAAVPVHTGAADRDDGGRFAEGEVVETQMVHDKGGSPISNPNTNLTTGARPSATATAASVVSHVPAPPVALGVIQAKVATKVGARTKAAPAPAKVIVQVDLDTQSGDEEE